VRRRRTFQICYIASHGQRRKLVGFGDKVIHLENLVEHCRPSPRIGYIFGACDFVTPDTARKFLLATRARFVAGYQKAIPWTESMLVDCLFLSYLLGGTMKWVRTKHGERIPPLRALEDFEITRSQKPQKVAGQLYRDFPLAHDITFSCFNLDRGRGGSRDSSAPSTSTGRAWTAPGASSATSSRPLITAHLRPSGAVLQLDRSQQPAGEADARNGGCSDARRRARTG